MYVRRILGAAAASAAVVAGLLVSAPLAVAGPAPAAASTPTAAAAAASINCYDFRVYNTVGRVTCSGTGLFRAKGNCAGQPDQYSNWVRVNNSEATAYVECRHKIRGVSAETQPGA